MIQQLSIKNFKSIKDLNISCKKLNVFIGEPNSGKSNLIEALSLQSQNAIESDLNKQIFRYKNIGDLFYDFNINNPIEVNTGDRCSILKFAIRDNGAPENLFHFLLDSEKDKERPYAISHEGKVVSNGNLGHTTVHFYEYKRLSSFFNTYMPHLSVPYGDNLPSLLLSNAEYKKWVSEFLKSKGLTLTLRPTENEILASKIVDEEIYSYPYFSLSETLQRVIFYTIALKSNKDSIILLDEPESNTFPFYTKYLAERIALDETNQFFITTHNPYLLLSIIEKSKKRDLNVCIAQMKNYQTILSTLTNDQISEVLDLNSDVFFNFDKILNL
jgi:energy-coupling factor transporter ATP-binding protein EcfA2